MCKNIKQIWLNRTPKKNMYVTAIFVMPSMPAELARRRWDIKINNHTVHFYNAFDGKQMPEVFREASIVEVLETLGIDSILPYI